MTYNKSQEQTLSKVPLGITSSPFSHDQLYIALNHVRDYGNIRLYVMNEQLIKSNESSRGCMLIVDNIVYQNILDLNGPNHDAVDESFEDSI
jgi:hypothetical protein